jgi:large exoprotein involved in heme utilization and adhesion
VNPAASGQGGMISITAESVNVINGATLTTSTRGRGDAGSIAITARDRVFVDGVGREGLPTTILSSVQPGATGNGRNIVIDSQSLTIQNGAQIAVGSQGTGVGGDIRIRTDFLTLDRQGKISAETASTTGGNITLDVPNLLLLRRGSNLSTTAGTAQAGGDGGNIAIASGFIVAVAAEDSNITADAFTGQGGNIDITTPGIFGIEFRDRQTPLSDITASSQFGINGVVEIDKLDVDPSNGLVALPSNVVDAGKLITQNCRGTGETASQQSEFVVTGRGGLPPNPSQSLSSDAIWSDLQAHALLNQPVNSAQTQARKLSPAAEAIVEAQGLVIGANGNIMLVAQASTITPDNSALKPVSCPVVVQN